jgi:hypothetical protein
MSKQDSSKEHTPTEDGHSRRRRRRAATKRACPICGQEAAFYWTCRCGFEMCQRCMDENTWGVTCNNITWVCPDCGDVNSY